MRTALITGGAGFIGVNAADRLTRRGWKVVILDNLARPGASLNIEWLRSRATTEFHKVDIRNAKAVDIVVAAAAPDIVLHLAGQVAITRSLTDPRTDFEVNALGTLNVLEAVRRRSRDALLIFASTNKVYGRLESLGVEEHADRYQLTTHPRGVSEAQPLDFRSPYGCSKGAADQYALDFHASYGLRTVVFRQSCIYGPRQFGTDAQGWVAWFLLASLLGKPVTIYGDGKQVRDLLHVDDLLDLYELAAERADECCGKAFNVGGGPANTMSVKQLVTFIERELSLPLMVQHAEWRTGDQPVFVADVSKVEAILGWTPTVNVVDGLMRLAAWMKEHRTILASMHMA